MYSNNPSLRTSFHFARNALLATVFAVSATSVLAEDRKIDPNNLLPDMPGFEVETADLMLPDFQLAQQDVKPQVQPQVPQTAPQATPQAVGKDIGISVLPVSHISLDTLGVYDIQRGGLPFDVWKGSNHGRVRRLLEAVPEAIASPSLRQLLVRLLLSTAQPPASANIKQNIFMHRVEALLRLDEMEWAQRLLELVPQEQRDEQIARAEYTARLLGGDVEWACARANSALSKYTENPEYWEKLAIFCLAREKKTAEAELLINVMREQGRGLSPAFVELSELMFGLRDKLSTRLEAPVALDDAAIFALSGWDGFPEGYMKNAPLPVARLVAVDTRFPDYLREEAQKRLDKASAIEQVDTDKAARLAWFKEQFAQGNDKQIAFSKLFNELETNAGRSDGSGTARRRAFRLYSMLEALGFGNVIPSSPWQGTVVTAAEQVIVSPLLLSELRAAAEAEKVGETVLLSAIAVGQVPGLEAMSDASIADIVKALVKLGFRGEAEDLAAEAMTALY